MLAGQGTPKAIGFDPLTLSQGPGVQFSEDHPEFSLYVALKIGIYGRFAQRAEASGPAEAFRAATHAVISSRRLHRSLASRTNKPALMRSQYTDFFETSSHFVRERLKKLNHGTVLSADGRGVRRSTTYRWEEPIEPAACQSYRRLEALLGGDLNFAFDIHRILDRFGTGPFAHTDFVELFRDKQLAFVGRRRYRIATLNRPASSRFTQFLLARMGHLVASGLLARDGATVRLTSKGEEVAHWFQMFAYSVAFKDEAPARRTRPKRRAKAGTGRA